jgi:acetyl-CoA C-acetyltransferase
LQWEPFLALLLLYFRTFIVDKQHLQTVYLVDGARTPFSRHLCQNTKTIPPYSKLDLAISTAQALLLKQAFTASQLDDIVIASSTTNASKDLAQQLAQYLQCQATLIPHTFLAGENCGIQALQYAHQQIAFQQKSLILLGGIEVSTAKSVALNRALSAWIREWQAAKGLANKLKVLNHLHTQHFQKENTSGSTKDRYLLHEEKAEKIANYLSISAEAMAEYVKLSQRRLKYAQRNKLLKNIVPVFYPDGSSLHRDEDIINADPESLKQTIITGNPPTGIITKASVSQATDGACLLLLANQEIIDNYNLSPLAILSEPNWANKDNAIEKLLTTNQYQAEEIDYWEWDETSAAEILALEKKPQFASIEAFQSLSNVNIDGGSLALGNPNTANKFRCILQLAAILKREKAQKGICHFSFANGQTSALLLQCNREGE